MQAMSDVLPDPWAARNLEWVKELQPKGTRGSYGTYWKQFVAFCEANNRTSLPPNEHTVVGFMRHLLERGMSRNTINLTTISAINEQLGLHGYPPFETKTNRLMRLAKKAIKRAAREEQLGRHGRKIEAQPRRLEGPVVVPTDVHWPPTRIGNGESEAGCDLNSKLC